MIDKEKACDAVMSMIAAFTTESLRGCNSPLESRDLYEGVIAGAAQSLVIMFGVSEDLGTPDSSGTLYEDMYEAVRCALLETKAAWQERN